MIELTRTLLDRSPEETSRYLCLGLLDEADRALGRLERADDVEALHDFRVALRRLRSLLRAYRSFLKGSGKRKHRAPLKELASRTNAARDAEVAIEWLSRHAGDAGVDPEGRSGADLLLSRLRERQSSAPSPEVLRAAFGGLQESLRKSLSRLRLRIDEGDESTFLSATGALVARKAKVLQESLGAISSAEDGERLHRTRIEAKRLRYILEPLQGAVSDVRGLVSEMKSLQDVLGALQDTRVLMETLSEELEGLALEEARRLRDMALHEGTIPEEGLAPTHPGLLGLLRLQRERREAQYQELTRAWLGVASEPFFREVFALAARLEAQSKQPKPRRRFLLGSLPEEAKRRPARLVRQGFLPGRRIREEILAVGSGKRTRRRRIARMGTAFEMEESLSRDAFEKFWKLCGDQRLERFRYEIRENERTWWIDDVRERNVILAEVEGDGEIVLPPWLEPTVEREVTGSKRWEWESIARSKGSSGG